MERNRKNLRLREYNYSGAGYYFVTVCTYQKQMLFGSISPVGARHDSPTAAVRLSEWGKIVEDVITSVPDHFECAAIEKYVVMPNHVHIIFAIQEGLAAGASRASPLRNQSVYAKVVGYLKAVSSKRIHQTFSCDCPVWQRGSYDHIIRNEYEFQQIWNYIDENPLRWPTDDYDKG